MVDVEKMDSPPIIVILRNRHHFGAQILTLPILFTLRRRYSNHPLWIFSAKGTDHIYQQIHWIDKNILVQSPSDLWRQIPKNPKLLVSLRPSSLAPALASILRKPERSYGLVRSTAMISWAWHHTARLNSLRYRGLHYLELINDQQSQSCPIEAISAPFSDLARLANEVAGETPAAFRLLLMPGGGAGEFKKWGVMNFIALARELKPHLEKEMKIDVILGPSETQESAEIQRAPHPDINIYESPSLPTLCALVKGANLVVANDCGPSHIAQCLGVPFVGLYNYYKEEWYWPRPDSISISAEKLESELKRISLKNVLTACLAVLQNPGKTHPPMTPLPPEGSATLP